MTVTSEQLRQGLDSHGIVWPSLTVVQLEGFQNCAERDGKLDRIQMVILDFANIFREAIPNLLPQPLLHVSELGRYTEFLLGILASKGLDSAQTFKPCSPRNT